MYQEIKHFLNLHFPSIEGCILFGSYAKNPEKANDIDLLLVDNKFSFSNKESFKHNGKLYNTIKANPNEILNIVSKQYQQKNLFYHIVNSGVIVKDAKKNLFNIKSFITEIPSEQEEIIVETFKEVCKEIHDTILVLKNEDNFVEYQLTAGHLIAKMIDALLLSKRVFYLTNIKNTTRFLKEKFPQEYEIINHLTNTLITKKKTVFVEQLVKVVEQFNFPVLDKYCSYTISDDFSHKQLCLYVEKTFSFKELKPIIDFLHESPYFPEFYVYQSDFENKEKEGCYFIFNNQGKELLHSREKVIENINNLFKEQSFLFPYNNIYSYPNIKFGSKENALMADKLLFEITETIQLKTDVLKENFIYSFILQLVEESDFNMQTLEDYYTMKLDKSAKNSSYFFNNQENNRDKLLASNDQNKDKLISVFENEVKYDVSKISTMPMMIKLQVVDRVLSIFLNKDFQKLFYISCIKHKLNEKVS
jgi:hypothetical protein